MSNLAEVSEETTIEPLQHVAGPLNSADILTRCSTTPDDVREGSTWQAGPAYLSLDRKEWPFSRDFLDVVPDQELRAPKATFNFMSSGTWESCNLFLKSMQHFNYTETNPINVVNPYVTA